MEIMVPYASHAGGDIAGSLFHSTEQKEGEKLHMNCNIFKQLVTLTEDHFTVKDTAFQ